MPAPHPFDAVAPLSHVTYQGDGETTAFHVPFPYIDLSHLKVSVDGVLYPFTLLNSSTVALTLTAEQLPPAEGAEVRIQRVTPSTDAISLFTSLARKPRDELILNARQLIYLAQEIADFAINSDEAQAAAGAKDAAEASAAAAAASAAAAAASAATALGHRNTAAESAAIATTASNDADIEANRGAVSADAARTSELAALASQQGAAQSAATASAGATTATQQSAAAQGHANTASGASYTAQSFATAAQQAATAAQQDAANAGAAAGSAAASASAAQQNFSTLAARHQVVISPTAPPASPSTLWVQRTAEGDFDILIHVEQ